ncbi:MAG TPA: YgiT-type zinc finger protein [Phycisphaerae bacterium]|nr:YgiT-type zinc finger protein [Phycisphaerae bacterium]
MNCSIQGCPGEYEDRQVAHTVRHRGRLVVVDHVPAEVCGVCGDVLLKPQTIRRLESLLADLDEPTGSVPLYEFADATT